jgi:hypothetical protein
VATVKLVLRWLGVVRFVADTLAATGAVLAAAAVSEPISIVFLVLALGLVTVRGLEALGKTAAHAAGPTGGSVLARMLVVLALSLLFASARLDWAATLVVLGTLLAETLIAPVARLAVPYVENLPGIAIRNHAVLGPRWIFVINTAGLVAFGAALAAGVPGVVLVLFAVALLLPTLFVFGDASLRVLARHRAEGRLPAAIAAYGPTFLLHWYAPIGSAHQVTMWLPYLERLNRPFIILIRNPATFAEISPHTTRPIVVRRFAAELNPLIVPGLKTAFYVNTSPRNAHMLTFLDVNQIQLNHGDSDKAPSYRRAFRLYDKNFVAGQAAIDRFANHGVKVPREAFEIVGRPQVESITITDKPIRCHESPVVLYAPTWFGYHEDSRYCSLPIGYDVVSALIRRGCTVIFRPHPWSWRTPELGRQADRIAALLRHDADGSGRSHVFGRAAQQDLSLVDCFNRADALVADVSSVVPDFLYSEKPYAVVSMQPGVTSNEFIKEFPLALGGYVLNADLVGLDGVLNDLLVEDPEAEARKDLKSYYLGSFPPACYADGFLDAARPYV